MYKSAEREWAKTKKKVRKAKYLGTVHSDEDIALLERYENDAKIKVEKAKKNASAAWALVVQKASEHKLDKARKVVSTAWKVDQILRLARTEFEEDAKKIEEIN